MFVFDHFTGPFVPSPPQISLSANDDLPIVLLQRPDDVSYLLYSIYGGYFDAIGESRDEGTNLSATGHLINHPSDAFPNVDIVHFRWEDILFSPSLSSAKTAEVAEATETEATALLSSEYMKYTCCNFIPQEKEWYFDSNTETTVTFPKKSSGEYWKLLKGRYF